MSLRRPTSVAQKPPAEYGHALAKFVAYVECRRRKTNLATIIAALAQP